MDQVITVETPFEQIGGTKRIRELVDHFYDLMELEEGYAHLRSIHSQDLSNSRERLYLFLVGWLGGPDLYSPVHGHPRLRARHLPFAIGIKERDQWLACMFQALNDLGVEGELATKLHEAFFKTGDWMRNQQG